MALALAVVGAPAEARRDSVAHCDATHRVKPTEFIIPAAAAGAAAIFTAGGWPGALREGAQRALSGGGRCKTRADDYMQYAPMAAVYGLNLAGVRGCHGFKDRTAILAMAYATMGLAVNGIKLAAREQRPDSPARNSFPSGHTATAFMGAEFMRREYAGVSPWVAYSGYAVAAATGLLHIYNDRHWANDVVAGAAIGIASTRLAYWLYPRIFARHGARRGPAAAILPSYAGGGAQLTALVTF